MKERTEKQALHDLECELEHAKAAVKASTSEIERELREYSSILNRLSRNYKLMGLFLILIILGNIFVAYYVRDDLKELKMLRNRELTIQQLDSRMQVLVPMFDANIKAGFKSIKDYEKCRKEAIRMVLRCENPGIVEIDSIIVQAVNRY